MIPDFNENGYLPKGIHIATMKEIKQRFGMSTTKRRDLFKRFKSLVNLLRKHKKNIKILLLNGSFVTNKESPEDLDCVLIVKDDFDFCSPEARQLLDAKRLFNTDVVTFTEQDVNWYRRFINFFGHDRSQMPKGLVEVIL